MKNSAYLSMPLLLLSLATAQASPFKLDNDERKSSYALGVDYMNGLQQDQLALDNEAFLQGIRDVQAGHDNRLGAEGQRKALDYFVVKRLRQRQHLNEQALIESKAFLSDNKSRFGITQLPSGLQYKVLKMASTGRKPRITDGVAVRYRLTDSKGKALMASPADASTQKLLLNAIFPGLQEALLLMKEGDKWQVYIPPELAFGANGTPDGLIRPNQVLVYDLELVAIVPADQAQQEMDKPTIKGGKPNTF